MTRLAALTGDLVRSTEAGPAATARAMDLLSELACEVSGWDGGADPRFTRFRGDGWQVILTNPVHALRAALVISARLAAERGLPGTRIAIGIGTATTLGTRDLSDAAGPAFEAAGAALDRMGRARRMAIAGEGLLSLHDQIVALLDERVTAWTVPQAEALRHYLHPDAPSASDIAPRFGISAQAVTYRLQGARAVSLRLALRRWEDAFGGWQDTGVWA